VDPEALKRQLADLRRRGEKRVVVEKEKARAAGK